MLWYLIAGVFAVLLLGLLAVAVGPDRFVRFWLALPAIVRTWVQVALGAIAVWCLTDGLTLLLSLGLPSWVKGLLGAIALALTTSGVVAVNPADGRYGLDRTPQPTGRHELPPATPGDEADPADAIPLEEYLPEPGGDA